MRLESQYYGRSTYIGVPFDFKQPGILVGALQVNNRQSPTNIEKKKTYYYSKYKSSALKTKNRL